MSESDFDLMCTTYDFASRRRAAEQRHKLTPFELTELHAVSVAGDCVTA
jgi:hypothetical protein